MSPADALLLSWGVLVLYVPGGAVLAAALGGRRRILLVGAPLVTFAITYVSGVVTGLTGWRWGPLAFALVALVFLAVALLVGRGRRAPISAVRQRPSAGVVLTLAGVLSACALALSTHLRGLGGLGTLPQEHDTVLHGVVVAHIMLSGLAAPWQAFPADVLTGEPATYYPNGLHQYAALVGSLGADPVNALNAATVVLFCVVMPVGVAVLASLLRPRSLRGLSAVTAALLCSVAYRPIIALLHDGGILANAAALAVAPGAIAALVIASRYGWAGVLPVALGAAGAVAVHPTNAVVVGASAIAWLIAEMLTERPRWAPQLSRLRTLVVAGGVAGVLLVPLGIAAATATDTVTSWPRDFPVTPLNDAIGISLSATYGGFLDPTLQLTQALIALLSGVGVAACLVARRNGALLAALAFWTAFFTLFLMDRLVGPLAVLAGVFYNSYVRINGGLALFQWLTGAVAVSALVWGIRHLLEQWSRSRAGTARHSRAVSLALGASAVAILAVACIPYAQVNTQAVAARYDTPDFIRVDEDDLAAARYVRDRIEPGERVMNNANDGSTFGYVLYGLPVVETATLAQPSLPYTADLLVDFDELDTDPAIRSEACRLDIAYVIADAEAPGIGVASGVYPYLVELNGQSYTTPPGFAGLEDSPVLDDVAHFGDVTVYEVDRATLNCSDRSERDSVAD
ncbi:DUF6541 family protein [Geodermatophilus sp. SYSU D01180]